MKTRICKLSMLWAACTADIPNLEIMDYIYEAMAAQEGTWSVNSISKMPRSFYYMIRLICRVKGKVSSAHERFLSSYRSTLLHSAVYDGKHDICEWLLERKADPEAKDHSGDTPLMIAHRLGLETISKLLSDAVCADSKIIKSNSIKSDSYWGNINC
jgi:ankyrin repeat protein